MRASKSGLPRPKYLPAGVNVASAKGILNTPLLPSALFSFAFTTIAPSLSGEKPCHSHGWIRSSALSLADAPKEPLPCDFCLDELEAITVLFPTSLVKYSQSACELRPSATLIPMLARSSSCPAPPSPGLL